MQQSESVIAVCKDSRKQHLFDENCQEEMFRIECDENDKILRKKYIREIIVVKIIYLFVEENMTQM